MLSSLDATTNCPSYPLSPTPSILIGVSTSKAVASSDRVAVIKVEELTPSPALILVIPTSCPLDPTIRNSSTLVSISIEFDG